jgi:hypothetical protein
MRVGDKCPQCNEGLLVRTEVGIECDECSFSLEMPELVEAQAKAAVTAGEYIWKPKSFKIRLETPEQGEEFLRGLILARQNNNSPLFADLIEAVNLVLQPFRAAKLQQEMQARAV